MKYEIQIMASVKKSLRKIPRKDQERIFHKIISLSQNPRPEQSIKLTSRKNAYRVRQGDYRIVYTIEDQVLVIIVVRIGHRREVYD